VKLSGSGLCVANSALMWWKRVIALQKRVSYHNSFLVIVHVVGNIGLCVANAVELTAVQIRWKLWENGGKGLLHCKKGLQNTVERLWKCW
jgi:hypothetical protein